MKNKNSKPVPWELIKAAYMNGAKNKDIAQDFKVPLKKLQDYISRHKWKKEKEELAQKNAENRIKTHENSYKITQEKIDKVTLKAVNFLDNVIEDPETKTNDKIQAAKAIIDISGLKTIKQDFSEPITINLNRNYD